jgi:hypothetical protein
MVITTLTYILDHGANINNTNNDNENALIIASKKFVKITRWHVVQNII